MVFAIGQRFKVEAGKGEVGGAFVEAKDRAVGQDGEVGVGAGAGVEDLVDGPGFAFVVAEFDGKIFAVAIAAGSFLAIGAGKVVGIGEQETVLSE